MEYNTGFCAHGYSWSQPCVQCGRGSTWTYNTVNTTDEETRLVLMEIRDLLREIRNGLRR